MTRPARRPALGLLGTAWLLLTAGCPDTIPGATQVADSGTIPPTMVWRQTIDVSNAGMHFLRGWMRFAAGGTRAYVATWGDAVGLMTVTDGLLSAPTKLPIGADTMSDIRFGADEQVVFVGSYYKDGAAGHAVSAFSVQGDGTFLSKPLGAAFEGAMTPDAMPPDFAESIALHPSGARLYVGFANTNPGNPEITENSQIGLANVAPDASLSEERLFSLDSGGTSAMTLALSPAGDALYASQVDTGKVNRFYLDGTTGDPVTPPAVATAGALADIGPICIIGGEEHVYVASAPALHDDPTGGVHHFQFDGTTLTLSSVTGASQHPGLFRVHSIVADEGCRHLFVVGERGTTDVVLHVFEIDPTTGEPVWISALEGVAQMAKRYRISLSPDGRFLYALGWFQHLLHVFEVVRP
jgi:hypothetical protein